MAQKVDYAKVLGFSDVVYKQHIRDSKEGVDVN